MAYNIIGLTECKESKKVVIVIDVLRAFTTSAWILHNGIKEIFLVKDLYIGLHNKHWDPRFILVGEKGGRFIPGFDYENSPAEMKHVKFKKDAKVVLRTSSGTRGVISVIKQSQVERIYVGSFLTRTALQYLIEDEDEVSFLITGSRTQDGGDEDVALADYLLDKISLAEAKDRVENCFSAKNWIKNKDDIKEVFSEDFDFLQKVIRTNSYDYVKLTKEKI